MYTVDGLIFDSGIPPWVEQENIVRRVQCNASAPRAQADEYDSGFFRILKDFNGYSAVLSFATEFE